jgi:AmmeMemoRadiSam system protein B
MVRSPIVAGMFYEDYEESLKKEIEECFLNNKFGPGSLPSEGRNKKIIGIIAPHAGYKFSGMGQAWCYKEIAESELADTYIILGTNHTGIGTSSTLLDDFETPLGIVKTDIEFAQKLIDSGFIIQNKEVHDKEHSIEVQLPFLQFINKDQDFKVVPIAVSSNSNYELFGKKIIEIAKELGRKICLICSSDFTHFGINYAYMPFRENVKENLEKLDKGAIKFIEKLDAWSFINYIDETSATICGRDAIATMISACNTIGGVRKVRLLRYYTSGDVVGDYANAVGYASIVIE